MITLQNDQLSFQFPEIIQALRRLVENHVKTTVLPAVVAEDRQRAVDALRARRRYQGAARSEQAIAERHVLEVTPAAIENALRAKARATIPLLGVNGAATVVVQFQRTLRIPDDGRTYPLPAGMGRFPLQQIDDFQDTVDPEWLERGGVLMPMYQSEGLWMNFSASYPFALKVAAGKINAMTGEPWSDGLNAIPQNYAVLPEQPWLDGFAIGKGAIRQFVAMPLGAGYSVEEQITGKADFGGIQLQAYPMQAEAYFRNELIERLPRSMSDVIDLLVEDLLPEYDAFSQTASRPGRFGLVCEDSAMGLGAGGRMRQEIFEDPHSFEEWDQTKSHRCFVHLCNSLIWRQITGANPPHPPLTPREYEASGIPWFDYYRDDLSALPGSEVLNGVKSVETFGKMKGEKPVGGQQSLHPGIVVQYGNARRPDEIREWVRA